MSGTLTPVPQVIQFNEIPSNLQVPGDYAEIRSYDGNVGVQAYATRTLLFAQMGTTGTTAGSGNPGQLYTAVSASQAVALCGSGSPGAEAAKAYLAGNSLSQLDIIPLKTPNTGGAAVGAMTLTGASTGSGTLSIGVNGVNYRVGTSPTDTVTSAMTALKQTIAADPNAPFVMTIAAGVITPTAKWLGLLGNDIDIRWNPMPGDAFPPGFAGTITGMAGGTLTPDITGAIATAAAIWYTEILMPFYDATSLGLIGPELDRRYTALGKEDEFAWCAYNATYGSAQALAGTQQGRHICFLPMYLSRTPPYVHTGGLAGVASFALSNDPARQLRGITLPYGLGPSDTDVFVESQRQLLLAAGQSSYTTELGTVVIERLVTANTQNSLGVADPNWHDVMAPRTLSRVRYDWNTYKGLVYPNAKLAPDGSLAAQGDLLGVVTPTRMRGSWAARSRLYEELGWLVDTAANAQQSTFQINASNPNRLDEQLFINVIGNLMVSASAMLFQQGG